MSGHFIGILQKVSSVKHFLILTIAVFAYFIMFFAGEVTQANMG